MSERIVRSTKGMVGIEIPDLVTQEEEMFVRAFYAADDAGRFEHIDPGFGHALSTLVTRQVLRSNEQDSNKRNIALREKALDLVHRYGEKIIPLLTEELRLSLDLQH